LSLLELLIAAKKNKNKLKGRFHLGGLWAFSVSLPQQLGTAQPQLVSVILTTILWYITNLFLKPLVGIIASNKHCWTVIKHYTRQVIFC
jgi:hypothetical protein